MQPQVIHSLHPRTLHGKSLRNLQGLCDGNLTKAMALLNSLHRHYSRPCTVLALDLFDTPSLSMNTGRERRGGGGEERHDKEKSLYLFSACFIPTDHWTICDAQFQLGDG